MRSSRGIHSLCMAAVASGRRELWSEATASYLDKYFAIQSSLCQEESSWKRGTVRRKSRRRPIMGLGVRKPVGALGAAVGIAFAYPDSAVGARGLSSG